MNFYFFASFIIFIVWLAYELSKTGKKSTKVNDDFWSKEHQANRTRKKPLDNLDYIIIPFDVLPMNIMTDDESVAEYHETLRFLSEQSIVNFTGISNTDLKLQYGAPNITSLTKFDQNYTSLVRTLHNWGKKLYDAGYTEETKTVLEFAVSTKTDIGSTYELLAGIYQEQNAPEKIKNMIPIAENLNSATKGAIVRMLQKSCP